MCESRGAQDGPRSGEKKRKKAGRHRPSSEGRRRTNPTTKGMNVESNQISQAHRLSGMKK